MAVPYPDSKRQQWTLVAGLVALVLPILFSTWAVSRLEETLRRQRDAFEVRAHLNEIDDQLKNWFVIVLSERDSKQPNAELPELEKEIEALFSQAETYVAKDPHQLARVIALRDHWLTYRQNPDAVNLSKLQELDDRFFDIDDVEFESINRREPVVINTINRLLQITGFLSFASIAVIIYAVFSMRRENANKARILVEMQALQEQALQASRLKSKFLATVSHEIRTPLNGIIGLSDLLKKRSLTPDFSISAQRQFIDVIHQSGKTLLRIINDILDYSKIESDQIVFERVEFDIARVFNQVLFTLSAKSAEKNISLSCDVDPTLPRTVLGDPDRLAQVLFNLIGNAIKFTSVGTVTLKIQRGSKSDDSIRFTVVDTGIGIAKEKIPDLFKPFSQGQKNGTSGEPGTGLGLSISKHLVAGMGGEIEVESSKDRGSVFHFEISLPAVNGEKIGDIKTEIAANIGDTGGLPHDQVRANSSSPRILVAEDNPTNQLIAQSMLTALGYNTLLAANGKEAIASCKENEIDLILMDCQMPVMDGFEATEKIRAAGADTPIVALTANASKEDEALCQQAGMNGFLAKPITIDFLAKELARLLPRLENDVDLATLQTLEEKIGKSATHKVVDTFCRSLSEFRGLLSEHIRNEDLQSLQRLGHRFRSAAEACGALPFRNQCAQLEKAESLAAIRRDYQNIRTLCATLEKSLRTYLQQPSNDDEKQQTLF